MEKIRIVVDSGLLGEIPNGKAGITLYAEQKDEKFNTKTELNGNNLVAIKGLLVILGKILLDSKKDAEIPNREIAREAASMIELNMDILENAEKAEGETE